MSIRISIVTICFNNPEELKETISAIDAQLEKPFEHLIIDGSTNTEIKDYLENTPQPTYRSWLCERDKGISDAFNKGILRSTGDVIHLQNSGDYYYDNEVLKLVKKEFETKPEIKWLHGKYVQYRGGVWVVSGKPFDRKKLYRGMRTIGHPAMFVKKELYDKYGLFDINKKIAMDYDFLVRIADEPFSFIERPLIKFLPGGVSDKKMKEGLQEARESYFKYKGFDAKLVLWQWRIILLHEITKSGIGKMLFRLKNRKKIT